MPRTRSQKALAQDSAPPPTQKVSKKSKKITKKEVLTPNPALSQEKMKISFSSFVKERYTKFSNDYLKESKLGSGNFGEVIKVTQKSTSMKRAVKIIDKSKINKKDHEALLREIEVLKNMDHPNIVKIYEFYQDSKKLYIVMELCQGKELFEYLVEEETKFSEFDICNLLQQLFGAICYAHNKKIVHRDIKPENILIFKDEHDNFKLKVIDWGTAKLVQPNEKLNEKTGSMYYIAPEVLSGKYDEKCDVWSCGVILYMLITGQPPFGGDSQEEVFKNIKKGKFDIELPEFDAVSEDLKILLKLMLTIDCKKRPSALELINMPWLSKDLHQETSEMRNNVIEGLKKLKGFTAEMKLQQAVLTYIAGQIASKEENEKMKEAFMKLDKNKAYLINLLINISDIRMVYCQEKKFLKAIVLF